MTATVTMLCGLPASGKSTYSEKLVQETGAYLLSSDRLRGELYGDDSVQGDNVELFKVLFGQAMSFLTSGVDVVFDATNISQKRRIHFNTVFKDFNRNVVYFNTSRNTCVLRDKHRDRVVGQEVIDKMYHNLKVPTHAEGWDNVEIVYHEFMKPFRNREHYEKILLDSELSYEYMFAPMNLSAFNEFMAVYELPQDNPHHAFSVSRHIFYVYKYVYQNYKPDVAITQRDFLKMLWVAVFHDIGKGATKSFYNFKGEPKRYASFIGHENVSAQIAVSILHALGYEDDYILEVAELLQLHMRLLNATGKSEKKLKSFVGQDVYDKLVFFREADTSAK